MNIYRLFKKQKARFYRLLHKRLDWLPEKYKPGAWQKGKSPYKEFKLPDKYQY